MTKVIVKKHINDGWNIGDGVEILDQIWLKKLVEDGAVELLEPMPKVETPKVIKRRVKK